MSQTSQSSSQNSSDFDFSAAPQTLQSAQLQSYVQKREYEVRRNLEKRPARTGMGHVWVLVFILMSSLIGLSVYSVTLIQEQQQEIAALQQENIAEIAGAREDIEAKNVITADGFSLVFNLESPQGFSSLEDKSPSRFLDDRDAVTTSYQFARITNGEEFISGISVEVAQFDNRFSREEFSARVVEVLGDTYSVSDESVIAPKSIALQRIDGGDAGVNIYTAVTADNYYVITLYTQTQGLHGLDEVNTFTDTMISSLFLN